MAVVLGAGCGGGTRQGGYGNFDVAWDIGWYQAGLTDCHAAGVAEVDIDVQDLRTNLDYHTAFNCLAYEGVSDSWPASTYSVALRAYDTSDTQLSQYVFPASVALYAGP
ncbi:MAG TPA: hypothetical protein VF518_12605, partial [Polyangia bacterium]